MVQHSACAVARGCDTNGGNFDFTAAAAKAPDLKLGKLSACLVDKHISIVEKYKLLCLVVFFISSPWPMSNFCGGFDSGSHPAYFQNREVDRQSGSHREWSFQGYNVHYGSGKDGGTAGGHTSARTMIKDLAPYQPNTVSLLQS